MTTATVDPAAAIAVARQELWEQLRELVDGGPADDLLDRVRKLTASVGRKITRARKLAEPAVEKPAPAKPEPKPQEKPSDRPRTVPAVRPAPSATVRVPATGSAPSWLVATELAKNTDRPAPRARPRWAYLLAIILISVLGITLATITGHPLAIVGTITTVLAAAGWRARHRKARAVGLTHTTSGATS